MIARALLRIGLILAKIPKIYSPGECPQKLVRIRIVIWISGFRPPQPYPGLTSPPEGVHDSDDRLPDGFQRIFYYGHLIIPTFVNDGPARLFVIDSGSSANIINLAAVRESTKVHRDNDANVRGVQGRVKEVSRADRVRLRFSNFSQNNVGMVALDLNDMSDAMGMEMGGLLGMPVLSNFVLTIDYRDAAIRLEFEHR